MRIANNQFGFIPRKSTTKAIYLLQGLMESYQSKERNLHMVLINLEIKMGDVIPQISMFK